MPENNSSRALACFAIAALSIVSPCTAQQLRPVFFELSAGATFGGSSVPHQLKYGFAGSALAGYRPGVRTTGGFVVAISGSVEAHGVSVACDVVAGGNCAPDFPHFWILSALAGWKTTSGSVRFLVGPGVAHSDSERAGAMQARLELAKPIFSRVSLLASGRFNNIPDHRGDSFRLGSIAVGFRLR